MLYVAEMARDCMFLLLIYTLGNLEKYKVTRCNVQFGEIACYGKKSSLFGQNLRPQYLVLNVN